MSLIQMSVSGAVLIFAIVAIRAAAIDRLPKETFRTRVIRGALAAVAAALLPGLAGCGEKGPTGEERETRLEQLRTEIMAGQGPDLYLMTPYRTEQVGYNAYQTVLDGGLFPDVETMKSSWTGFYNELLEYGDTPWFNGASAVSMYSLNPLCRFPDLIDYKGGRVLLTAGELAEYTRQCWELLSRGERIANGVPSVGIYVRQGGWFPLSVPELEDGGEDPWALMHAPGCEQLFHLEVIYGVEGTTAATFSPNKLCNRGELVIFLYRAYK